MNDADFDELLTWLGQRLGRRVSAQLSGPLGAPSNVRLSAEGGLFRWSHDVLLIDPASGRVAAFRVGDGQLVLIESELVGTEYFEPQEVPRPDGTTVLIGAAVEVAFRHVTLRVTDMVAL